MSQQALVVALHSKKNPCIYVHNIFKGNGFWPFGWVCLISVHNSNPRNCCLETEIRSWFRYRNVFDEDRLKHPRLGQFSFFWESTLLLGMIIQLEVMWYSRHRFFISFGPSSSVMKKCPFSLQTASQHSLDNFWSSGSCLNLCSLSRSKFPYNSALVWGTAMWRSVRILSCFQIFIRCKFPICSFGEFFAQICHCSVVTELIDRNNSAKNQLNVFIATVEANKTSFLFTLLLNSPLFRSAGGTKYRRTTFCKVEHQPWSSPVPFSVRFVSVGSIPFLLASKPKKWPTSLRKFWSIICNIERIRVSNLVPISLWLIRINSVPFLLWSRSQK